MGIGHDSVAPALCGAPRHREVRKRVLNPISLFDAPAEEW
jgi:hypothetical protein